MILQTGKQRKNSAFLLFEVLIAVVVLAVGITLVLRSFNACASGVKGLEDYLTAVSLINEKMFQLHCEGLSKVAPEGNFDSGYKKFSWKINSSPIEGLYIYKVNLSIIWNAANSTKTLTVDTYLKEPLLHS